MKINWRRWNRVLHRDLGYFFFGITLIYSISGIALNHIADWNPSYVITTKEVRWNFPSSPQNIDKTLLKQELFTLNHLRTGFITAMIMEKHGIGDMSQEIMVCGEAL